MNEAGSTSVTKRELLIFLYKYRRRLYLSFFIPFLLFIAASFVPTPRYEANSVLIIRLGQEYVYQPTVGNPSAGAQAIPFDRDQIFKSEVAILNSDDLHAAVIKAIGLERLYPELVHPEGISRLIGDVRGAVNKEMVALGLAAPDISTPEEKQARLLAEAVEIFDKRIDILLEKESAVIDITFEHKDRQVAQDTLNTLMKLYFEKRKQLFLTPRTGLAETEVEDKRQRMIAADAALDKFKKQHHIYSLDEEISSLIDLRDAAKEQAAVVSSEALRRKIASYDKQLDDLDAVQRQYNALAREDTIAQNAYNLYSSKRDEAESAEDIERKRSDSVRVIQEATAPPEPKRLQLLIILGGAFFSLLVTLGVAAYTEFSQSGFLTPEQIERTLRLPVIGVFPLYKHG